MMQESKERILLVDDEAPLLRLMQVYLERLGYRTEAKGEAASALAVFEQDPSGFDAVVADLTLPSMNGSDMALRMAATDAGLRVLLCSGYPFDLEALPGELRGRFAFLQKPFLPKMLAEALEELLGRSL